MFETSKIIKKFREEADKKEFEARALADLLFTKGHQRFYNGMLSLLLTFALAAHFDRQPTVTEDRFFEAGESFTAQPGSVISGNMRKYLLFGIGEMPLADGDPTSGEIYVTKGKAEAFKADSKVYVRIIKAGEIPRDVIEKTIQWQTTTPTFCRFRCNSVNLTHFGDY
jgi:hypothetical protein